MILNLNFFHYLLYLFPLIKNIISKERILFAFQMNRHGARAPYLGVKNGYDIYKEKWIQIEELSGVGKRMLYLLGVNVRKRYIEYNNFLDPIYNPNEIYIKSTDSNRTIESIYAFLQGLYPNGTGPKINPNVINDTNISYPPNEKYHKDFEYIMNKYNMNKDGSALPYQISLQPVHLFNKVDHELELYDTRYCSGHKEEYENRQKRKEIIDFVDKINNETNNIFMELEETNNYTFLYDYWTLYKYMDCFLCDNTDIRNFDYMKNKYNIEIIDKLRDYSKIFFDLDYYGTNFPKSAYEIGIVAISDTMFNIINWMDKAIYNYKNNIYQYTKFVIYSAHDSTIGSLESFLRYSFDINMDSCPFADSRFLELYINDNGEFKIRYLKGDNTIKLDMDYYDFKEKIMDRIWTDESIADFCGFEKNEKNVNNESDISFSIMIILIIINVVLGIYLLVFYFK